MITQQFIGALNRINFSYTHDIQSLQHEPVENLRSSDGFEVSYSVRLAMRGSDLPLQMILHLRWEGQHVMSCHGENEQENRMLVDWWTSARSRARHIEKQAERELNNLGYSKFMEHVESAYKEIN